jgi:hypothetical protein
MLTKSQNASRLQETRARMEDLMTKATAKDRASIEKHLAACDTQSDPARGDIWRRLAGMLGQLVGLPARTCGAAALTFFIPDGKYRKQVFALEDHRDGTVFVYLPDVSVKALREKLLVKTGTALTLPGWSEPYAEVIDGGVPELPNHIKPMLGWNRKAIKLTITADGSESLQVKTAEDLCALAAKDWADVVPQQ